MVGWYRPRRIGVQPTRGTLAVRVEPGPPSAARYCVDFGGHVLRDDGVDFKAKQAPAPARCPGGA